MSTPSHVPVDCPHCHRRGTVVRPSRWWLAALVGGYVIFSAMIFGAALLGPTIMAVLPLLLATGLGLLPFLHDRVATPPSCTACERIVHAEVGAPSQRLEVGVATPSARAA